MPFASSCQPRRSSINAKLHLPDQNAENPFLSTFDGVDEVPYILVFDRNARKSFIGGFASIASALIYEKE